jgi:hypothetical protein
MESTAKKAAEATTVRHREASATRMSPCSRTNANCAIQRDANHHGSKDDSRRIFLAIGDRNPAWRIGLNC